MKKFISIILLLFLLLPLWADEAGYDLIGTWVTKPFVMEQDDGLLTSPNADYSYPWLGIEQIEFLDNTFVLFKAAGYEYRAFYEIETLDFDNLLIRCTFKSGEVFILKFVSTEDEEWKYVYRIAETSILNSITHMVDETNSVEDEETPMDEIEEDMEEVAESLYIGTLKKTH